jgi:hypothetical protein
MTPSRIKAPGTGFWLVLFLVAVYLLSYSGSFHAIDEVSVMAMTESLVKHGRVSTDQIEWSQTWTPSQGRVGPDGHLYSKKGLGTALLGAPFYWLALHLPMVGAVGAVMIANALVTALTGWLVYRCVLLLGYPPVVGVLTALGYGLGTMAWPYARYFFSEPLAAFGLMFALWGLLSVGRTGQARYALLAGVGLGLALLAKVANAVTWPLFVLYGSWMALRRREMLHEGGRKHPAVLAVALLAPLLLSLVILAAYNAARSGNPLDMGYAADETFSTPLGLGLAGLLWSPGKSLFLYSPLLLVALLGIPALLRRDRATALLSLGIPIAYLLLYARWFMWWGGWSWGPRFLVPVLPFVCLFLAPVLDHVLSSFRWWGKAVLAAVALLSLGVQILGVAVDFNQYLLILYQRGIDSAEINFQAALSPLVGHWALLREGALDLVWARDLTAGLNWPPLLMSLLLLFGAAAGWYVHRRIGRGARWLSAGAAIVLLAIVASTVARLPAPVTDWEAACQSLSITLDEEGQPGDVVIVDLLPYANHLDLAVPLLDRYKAAPAYRGWARQEPVSAERQATLSDLSKEYRRLWLALDTTPEGDSASTTERWLDDHAYRIEGQWLSPAMRLVRYQLSASSPDQVPQARLDLRLGDQVRLVGYTPAGPWEVQPGGVLTFSLFWEVEQPVPQDYAVFVQLLDQAGGLQAQVDRTPVGGFQPTSTWQPGQLVRDNYGLEVPTDLLPGQYRLITGLYLPASMERLAVSTVDGAELGDHVELTDVAVVGAGRAR